MAQKQARRAGRKSGAALGEPVSTAKVTPQPGRARAGGAVARAATKAAPGEGELKARIDRLEHERDGLADENEMLKARCKELEARQRQAVERIDWIIDSLHNVLEKKS